MKISSAEFLRSAVSVEQYPRQPLPDGAPIRHPSGVGIAALAIAWSTLAAGGAYTSAHSASLAAFTTHRRRPFRSAVDAGRGVDVAVTVA